VLRKNFLTYKDVSDDGNMAPAWPVRCDALISASRGIWIVSTRMRDMPGTRARGQGTSRYASRAARRRACAEAGYGRFHWPLAVWNAVESQQSALVLSHSFTPDTARGPAYMSLLQNLEIGISWQSKPGGGVSSRALSLRPLGMPPDSWYEAEEHQTERHLQCGVRNLSCVRINIMPC
jgi:hypothetical protein